MSIILCVRAIFTFQLQANDKRKKHNDKLLVPMNDVYIDMTRKDKGYEEV